MEKYPHLNKYMEKKGKKSKTKVKVKKADLDDKKRNELIDQMLKDLGYIE